MSDDNEKLERLHQLAQELITVNAENNSRQVSLRMAAMTSGGYDFADTLHNIFLDFGYPAQLSFNNFWNMYRRFGIAQNVIELPVDTCWSSEPTIESDDARFMTALEDIETRIKLWTRMKGLDTRQRVGRYAGMFMRVKDGKNPEQPLEGEIPSAALIEMMPLYESQLEVVKSDTDPMSDTFGQPLIVQYSQSSPGSRNEEAKSTINIHASRIVFAAEGADNGWIYGIPALEGIYNSLMDLRKIIGGGAEGFYKNASQNIVFDLKDGASALSYKDKLDQFNEEYDDFSRNRSRRALWTPGMEATTLDSTLISPKDFFQVALNDVSAGSHIPATILIGQQTGRLASTEDGRQFLAMTQSRRVNWCTDMVVAVFDWFIKYGVLPSAEYDVEWDDLLARSDEEKLGNADKMATINEKQFKSGGQIPFNADEIREAAGFEDEDELPESSEGEEMDELDDEDIDPPPTTESV